MAKKYTLSEIDRMRTAIERSYPTGDCYSGKERSAEVEDRLRTYMQNGTAPEELEEMAQKRRQADYELHERRQEFYEEQRKKAPPPRVLKTAEDVIDEWFQTSVAQYDGASSTSCDLYDGFLGYTLRRFANRHAPDGVNIKQRDMERYLDKKGVRSRNAMFAKRYDGIQVVISGNVRSGNYST